MMRAHLSATVAVCLLGLQQGGPARVAVPLQDRGGGPKTATAGQLIISEFRLRGPAGAQDEYIEIYNASGSDHTVAASSGTGYGIAASDGLTRCSIPNGTVIPFRGHFLCVNSAGYSLGSYPAGNGTTATGDATYTTNIPDNSGIAIFNTNNAVTYALVNRLDAVGSTEEANIVYREGAGYPALTATSMEQAWIRRMGNCTGSGGGGSCDSQLLMQTTPPGSFSPPLDTDNNAFDFIYLDTLGTLNGGEQRLGAPGPENLSSPPMTNGVPVLKWSRLDTCTPMLASPNKVRDFTTDPPNNSTFGTYEIRRTWTNLTGVSLTRLRFRIVDISTFPSISGVADLRARTSPDTTVIVDRPPCGTGTSSVPVRGTTLEHPPLQSAAGGGFNATLSVGAVTSGTPLAYGASIDVRFLLGIEQTGTARFCVTPETLPAVYADTFCFVGRTNPDIVPAAGDVDFDQIADPVLYNQTAPQWRVLRSSTGFFAPSIYDLVGPGVTLMAGEYDGDGRLDTFSYDESTGLWVMWRSSTGYLAGDGYYWGGPGYEPVPGDYDGDGITDVAVYNAVTSGWYILTSTTSYTSSLTIIFGGPGWSPVPGQDFDGDGRADLVIYNEGLGKWYVLKSSTNFTSYFPIAWGGAGYTLVPGDYDGDGKADFGLYQRRTGLWYILKSNSGYTTSLTINSGGMGFLPMPADYDGDRRIDPAWYQPATTKFFALLSASSYSPALAIQKTFGLVGVPVTQSVVVPRSSREIDTGDFDGDFISDLTVYNQTLGTWSILKSTGGFTSGTSISWGGGGYDPAPGDYDGDGQGDLGLYQPSTGSWLVLLSSSHFTTSLNRSNGGPGYVPMEGDYDGDGKTDIVTYNVTTGLWFGLKSSTNYTTPFSVLWGGPGYIAAPGDFDGDGKQDLGVYNPATGDWSILTSSSSYTSAIVRNLGGPGYTPVPADFDGDGFTDFAVYQTSTGVWTLLKSSSGYTAGLAIGNGGPGYFPVAGDWDDDGRADIGVYNTTTGAWLILLSNANYRISLSKNWGGTGYAPVPVFP